MSLVTRIGICLACVLALVLIGLDIHYVRMLPAHADIDYSRAGFGIFNDRLVNSIGQSRDLRAPHVASVRHASEPWQLAAYRRRDADPGLCVRDDRLGCAV